MNCRFPARFRSLRVVVGLIVAGSVFQFLAPSDAHAQTEGEEDGATTSTVRLIHLEPVIDEDQPKVVLDPILLSETKPASSEDEAPKSDEKQARRVQLEPIFAGQENEATPTPLPSPTATATPKPTPAPEKTEAAPSKTPAVRLEVTKPTGSKTNRPADQDGDKKAAPETPQPRVPDWSMPVPPGEIAPPARPPHNNHAASDDESTEGRLSIVQDNGSAKQAEPPPPSFDEFAQLDAADMLALAKAKLQRGKRDEALTLLMQTAETYPQTPQAPEALLIAAGTTSDLDRGRQWLRRLIAGYPRHPAAREALLRLGEYSFILGDYEESARALNEFIRRERDPEKVRSAEMQLAVALLRSGNYGEARQVFGLMQTKYPEAANSPALLDGLAEAHLALGEVNRAEALLEKIETSFPNYAQIVKVLMNRGICAELLGKPERAEEYYRSIVRNYPRSVEAPLAEGRLRDISRPLIAETGGESREQTNHGA